MKELASRISSRSRTSQCVPSVQWSLKWHRACPSFARAEAMPIFLEPVTPCSSAKLRHAAQSGPPTPSCYNRGIGASASNPPLGCSGRNVYKSLRSSA